MKKTSFGIFDPRNELVTNIPVIRLNKVLLPDSQNILLKDGKIIRRKMRKEDLLAKEKVQTPDGNPIIHYHKFTKRSTGVQYFLAFTKAHIYHWNPSVEALDVKFTCSADCENWETANYNDKIIATNNIDPVLVWNTTGYFVPLQNTVARNITGASGATITRTDIAFVDGGVGEDTITTDEGDFVAAGFVAGNSITVSGTTNNNGTYTIISVVALTINVATASLTEEKGGASVTIKTGDPCVITIVGHGYSTGNRVWIVNVGGMVELNNKHYLITVINADKFSLDGINSTSYTTYTSGGTATKWEGIEYSRSYSNKTNVDETSAKDQKVLNVASTTGYSADDKIIIDRNTKYREEEGIVYSVQAGVSLTLKENLIYDHTADALTTVSADSAAGQKVLNVASTTGFEEMETVTINKGGDREEKRRIATIQGGTSLTMTVNLSFAHTQVQGDEVLGSGGQNDEVEEYVSYYLTKSKHLITYENYLILGYTYENGIYHPQRMRWNTIGNETDWLTGTKGSTEVGLSDVITGFGMYRGYLIVFKQESHFKYWLVASTYIFNGAFISMTIGCQCNGSIVNDNKGRLYWYASDGTIKEMSVGTISQPIQTEIIDKIYQSSVDLIKSAFIDETEEVWFSIPYKNALNNLVITLKESEQGERIWGQVNLAIPAFGNYIEA